MKHFFPLFLIMALLSSAFPVSAQEIIGIQEQIDSLKDEMLILQRKVYRDNMNTDVAATPSPAASSAATVKLGEYDEVIRTMNGKIDEIEFKVKQLEDKINTMNKDFDVRFKLLEGKPIPAAEGSVVEPKKFDTAVASGAPKSIVGDAVTTGNLKNLSPSQNRTASSSDVDTLYKDGLNALKAGNKTQAEQNFSQILEQAPNDKLAGNAQYWLGEVYYSNKDFGKAAVAFGRGYENYKDGSKGADSLLKLGLSMEQLGKKNEACMAFTHLSTEFPKAEASTKTKAQAEAKKLGCQ
jgi:tol-pal system protein YbgF